MSLIDNNNYIGVSMIGKVDKIYGKMTTYSSSYSTECTDTAHIKISDRKISVDVIKVPQSLYVQDNVNNTSTRYDGSSTAYITNHKYELKQVTPSSTDIQTEFALFIDGKEFGEHIQIPIPTVDTDTKYRLFVDEANNSITLQSVDELDTYNLPLAKLKFSGNVTAEYNPLSNDTVIEIPNQEVQIDNLTLKKNEAGEIFVNTADQSEQDNTLPITSAAVFAEIGNINALLQTI